MVKTRDELESMRLGELIAYMVANSVPFKVMNDIVDKASVVDAILASQERHQQGGDGQ